MKNFKGQKIAVLGLGLENTALIKYLYRQGARDITICDKKTREELEGSLKDLSNIPNLKFSLGESYLKELNNYQIIFRTPGLPYLKAEILQAKAAGAIISSQTKLFFDLSPAPIIGITGTKGKGTTTTLVGELLKKTGKKVYVGGNIGEAPIGFLERITKKDLVVLELSSFQLQDLQVSPHMAVVLDIKTDHLDYHSGTREYIESKRAIVEHQSEKDFAIINADYLTSFEFAAATRARVFYFSRRKSVDLGVFVRDSIIIIRTEKGDREVIKTKDIQLRGEHNLENIAAATLVAYLNGVSLATIKKVITGFPGLEHRLEFVREVNGIKFYNDSFSTTPDTTIAAINSFSEPIILLIGGSEKNADYTNLIKVIGQSTVKKIIPIGLTAQRIIPEIKNPKINISSGEKALDEAVRLAFKEARPGEIVLLSPASASFDHFNNYKERGKAFKSEVTKL